MAAPPGVPAGAALEVRGLEVAYGPVQVLFGVDFDAAPGEVVALLGTNGAGKSTVLRAVSGLSRARRGRVAVDGADVTRSSPQQLARAGVVMVPGGRGIFPGLTVRENLRMAGWLRRGDPAGLETATQEVLERFPILAERIDSRAVLLSGGEQQMLALGQALLGRPRLLLIDELSLGLAPTVVGELLGVVRQLAATGLTIVLVEQSVNVALSVSDRAVFLEKGEVRFAGPATDLAGRNDLLRAVFLGATAEPVPGAGGRSDGGTARTRGRRRAARRDEPPVLEARSVSRSYGGVAALGDVTVGVHPGEIVGLLGANGAGKTTLLDVLSGFVPADHGRVLLDGRDVTDLAPQIRALLGLGRSFQDARQFPGLTTRDNLAVACERFASSREPVAAMFRLPASLLSEAGVAERVDTLIQLLGLGAYRDKFASQLSTGTRRVVELGCLLAQEPRVLLLDEPSAGLAQREAEAMGPLLRRIRDATGCALVVVEHDVPLLTGACDRLVAMELGEVIADGPPSEVVRDPRVLASYLGDDIAAVERSGAARPRRRRRARAAAT